MVTMDEAYEKRRSQPRQLTMGVCYFFHNLTTDEPNDVPISGDCTFYAKLNYLSEPEIILIFQLVIARNNWNLTDKIQAAPDYHDHPLIVYNHGTIKFITEKCEQLECGEDEDEQYEDEDEQYKENDDEQYEEDYDY